jgi:hypothetical protein
MSSSSLCFSILIDNSIQFTYISGRIFERLYFEPKMFLVVAGLVIAVFRRRGGGRAFITS